MPDKRNRRRSLLAADGWLPANTDVGAVRHAPSPNYNTRPDQALATSQIDLLVIHYISLPANVMKGSAVEDFFLNRLDTSAHPDFAAVKGMKVSAHFFLRRGGELIQFVSCDKRAWHAGVSEFMGRQGCNDFSIGIELEGSGAVPFTPTQYQKLARLTQWLAANYPLRYVAGHSDIAPTQKQDPGKYFDWMRFLKSVESTGLSRPF